MKRVIRGIRALGPFLVRAGASTWFGVARCFRWLSSYPLLAAFLLSVAFFGLSFAYFTTGFGSPSDVDRMLTFSGYYTGTPEPWSTGGSPFLGELLARAYAWRKDVAWYAVHAYGLLFLSAWIFGYAVLLPRVTLRRIGWFAAGLGALFVPEVVAVTHHALAVLCVGAGVALIRTGFVGHQGPLRWCFRVVAAACLFSAAGIENPTATAFAALVATPWLVLWWIRGELRAAGTLALLLALLSASFATGAVGAEDGARKEDLLRESMRRGVLGTSDAIRRAAQDLPEWSQNEAAAYMEDGFDFDFRTFSA
ncbi:MAG: hypothetical protein KC416_17260, partial [Myxococcales bacterium]|nr:hypothetical protein [Myxococcales bacterium]